MNPILPNWKTLLTFLLFVSCPTFAHAWQDDPTGTTETQAEQNVSAEAKEFQELQNRLRTNQNRIDFLLRTLPIGFPEKRAQYRAEIERLSKANTQLRSEVFTKAKAAFKTSETPSEQSTQIIKKRLNAMLKPRSTDDVFDPQGALELIAMMKEKFPESPVILEYEFLANYAIERFENAEMALQKLEAVTNAPAGSVAEAEFARAKGELQATAEKYQQELMIRRLEANTNDLPRVLLVTTEGDILVELYENHAPNTVANFIHLVREQKFYDGKLFHLVKPGEYAMTGSPTGDGRGDAGYRIPCECYEDKIRSHFRGTLSMMAPARDRGGSQFFITQQPNPHTFDGRYTAFGRVIEGMDVLAKLKNVDLSGRLASTADVSKIVRAEVVRARSHAYMPEKLSVAAQVPGYQAGADPSNLGTSTQDSEESTSSFDLLLQGNGGGN